MLLYVNGLRRALHLHRPLLHDPTFLLMGPPSSTEYQDAIEEIIGELKLQWLCRICPIAMENRAEEARLLAAGAGHDGLSPTRRVAEDLERRGLSRSRSPHPALQLHLHPNMEEQSEGPENDIASFMESSGGRGGRGFREARSRSDHCGRNPLGGSAMGLPQTSVAKTAGACQGTRQRAGGANLGGHHGPCLRRGTLLAFDTQGLFLQLRVPALLRCRPDRPPCNPASTSQMRWTFGDDTCLSLRATMGD